MDKCLGGDTIFQRASGICGFWVKSSVRAMKRVCASHLSTKAQAQRNLEQDMRSEQPRLWQTTVSYFHFSRLFSAFLRTAVDGYQARLEMLMVGSQ